MTFSWFSHFFLLKHSGKHRAVGGTLTQETYFGAWGSEGFFPGGGY